MSPKTKRHCAENVNAHFIIIRVFLVVLTYIEKLNCWQNEDRLGRLVTHYYKCMVYQTFNYVYIVTFAPPIAPPLAKIFSKPNI